MNKSFVKFVTDFGPLVIFFFFYYNSDKNLRVAIPPFIIATLVAIKMNWSLKGQKLSYEQEVGWNNTSQGFLVWYLIMYFGSRLYISPPAVNSILGIVITALVIFIYYKIFYKPEVDSLNKAAKEKD